MKKKLTTLMVSGVIAFAFLIISPVGMSTKSDIPQEQVTSEIATVQYRSRTFNTLINPIDVFDELFEPITYIKANDKDELNILILKCEDYIARLNGNLETTYFTKDNIAIIQKEILRIEEVKTLYENDLAIIIEQEEKAAIEAAKWETRKTEYPIATEIWLYMKNELGWNDYVCAGVMGNLMTETGGQTLDINPSLYGHGKKNKGYYGICQWSAKYYPEVQGKDLQYQLNFLKDTVEYEFNTYGKLYQSNMKYEEFTQMTGDYRATALAFAKVYERCNSKYYSVRQTNAEKAYEYFTN